MHKSHLLLKSLIEFFLMLNSHITLFIRNYFSQQSQNEWNIVLVFTSISSRQNFAFSIVVQRWKHVCPTYEEISLRKPCALWIQEGVATHVYLMNQCWKTRIASKSPFLLHAHVSLTLGFLKSSVLIILITSYN